MHPDDPQASAGQGTADQAGTGQAGTTPTGAGPAAEPREHSRWEGALPRFSLNRRITVLVLLLTALVVGAVAAVSIPLELIPRGFEGPFLSVSVPWSDAPAPEVLEKVIVPLEEEVASVRGLDRMSSFATTGFGRIALRFKNGTDMDVAYREVRDRIERARPRMPEDAERVYIRKEDASGIPVAVIGVLVDEGVSDTYDLVQSEVVRRLERVDGVASVGADGLVDKEILIELDRQRTEAAGLNIYQLAQELSGDNFTLASGEVYSGGKKLLLRSVARYDSVADLENRLVAPSVRLGDIAAVKYEQPDYEFRIRVNSKPALALNVMKEGDANTLEVSQAVVAAVEEMADNPRLGGLEVAVIMNTGDMILESLDTLLDSGKVGGLFAGAVLFFFLRRFRLTLIIALSIPLSIVIALTVMYFSGETLNILTLLGLMICVGLLVDNSVVVAENIVRLHREGRARRDAVVRGAGEIALAIVMATLTTVAVFLPVSLVQGQAQFFLLRLSIPISVSLLASLFVALIFVPLAVYLTLPTRNGNGKGNGATDRPRGPLVRSLERLHRGADTTLRHAYQASFGRLNDGYHGLLGFALRHRLYVVLGVVLSLVVTGGLFAGDKVRIVDQDENERPGVQIGIEVPNTYTFEEVEAWFLEAERVLEANQEAWGLEGYFFFHRTNYGRIEGWFDSPRSTDLSPREVTEQILAALPEKPGLVFETGTEDQTGQQGGESTHVFTLNGEDPDALERVAEDLEELFLRVPGVLGLQGSGREPAPSEMALVIDRERAQRQGVNPAVVAGVVGYALRGQALPKFYHEGREIDVRVRFEEQDRERLDQLSAFLVPTESGSYVTLGSLTDSRMLQSAQVIRRIDKRLARTITLELAEGQEEATRQRLIALASGIDLPEGIGFGTGQAPEGMDEDLLAMLFAAQLSILFIYLLMGFLFESFILPLSILTTIPLAGIGVVWMHFVSGRHIDFLGVVGLVLLIGVVVNNGIVLIDYVNRLRREGEERTEALLLASTRRFRPIMMTALTTICGMIPLAIGEPTSMGLSYKSFGLTLIGGLTAATFLTLLVVPVFYTLFDDAREITASLWRRRPAKPPEGAAEGLGALTS
ncbi:MAG TPA: efflux RND transporter permease subunit [Thermoanaerobaculia bacterium]|nr:efflux RND transporter permease subunit [Thermoanaerobaculia bacterium]